MADCSDVDVRLLPLKHFRCQAPTQKLTKQTALSKTSTAKPPTPNLKFKISCLKAGCWYPIEDQEDTEHRTDCSIRRLSPEANAISQLHRELEFPEPLHNADFEISLVTLSRQPQSRQTPSEDLKSAFTLRVKSTGGTRNRRRDGAGAVAELIRQRLWRRFQINVRDEVRQGRPSRSLHQSLRRTSR